MKKDKFKDNKYKCDYCNTLNFITSYLVRDKCVICNKELSRKVKRKMRRILIKGFIKRCKIFEKAEGYYKNSLREWIEKYIFR